MSSMSASCSDLPTLTPVAARKVLAMPPPTISLSTLANSDSSTVSLVETFEPATMATSGRAGFAERALERLELTDQQRTRAGDLGELAHAVRRSLGAMRRAERVHHEDVAQRRHLPGEIFLVLLLALVEAHVLEQHALPAGAIDAREPVLLERHLLA